MRLPELSHPLPALHTPMCLGVSGCQPEPVRHFLGEYLGIPLSSATKNLPFPFLAESRKTPNLLFWGFRTGVWNVLGVL